MKTRINLSDEEKRRKLAQVDAMAAEGRHISEARKEVGIAHASTYYKWKKELKAKKPDPQLPLTSAEAPPPKPKAKKPKPYVEEVEADTPSASKIACIIGTPTDIGEVLRSMK